MVWPSVLSLNNLKLHKTKVAKNTCIQEKLILWLTFNPGLALTGFQTTIYKLNWHEPTIQPENQHLVSSQLKKNMWPRWALNLSLWYSHVILVSGYLVLCPVSKKYAINQCCMSLSTYKLEYGRYLAQLHCCCRSRARAIPLAMITMRKSMPGFPLVSYIGVVLRLAALWAVRAMLL